MRCDGFSCTCLFTVVLIGWVAVPTAGEHSDPHGAAFPLEYLLSGGPVENLELGWWTSANRLSAPTPGVAVPRVGPSPGPAAGLGLPVPGAIAALECTPGDGNWMVESGLAGGLEDTLRLPGPAAAALVLSGAALLWRWRRKPSWNLRR